jgi:hypothetical protein
MFTAALRGGKAKLHTEYYLYLSELFVYLFRAERAKYNQFVY